MRTEFDSIGGGSGIGGIAPDLGAAFRDASGFALGGNAVEAKGPQFAAVGDRLPAGSWTHERIEGPGGSWTYARGADGKLIPTPLKMGK